MAMRRPTSLLPDQQYDHVCAVFDHARHTVPIPLNFKVTAR